MKFERKAILTLTKKECDFLYYLYMHLTDEFEDINFNWLLDEISCKGSTYEQGDIAINIKYNEEEN